MKTHLSAQELAMYLGCQAKLITLTGYSQVSRLNAIDIPDNAVRVGDEVGPSQYVKPILRRLESMTEEENKEHRKLMSRETDGVHTVVIYQNTPESFAWLLSKGFDLFGYIPAGLAIDKETLSK